MNPRISHLILIRIALAIYSDFGNAFPSFLSLGLVPSWSTFRPPLEGYPSHRISLRPYSSRSSMGSSSLSWCIGCLIDVRGPSCLLGQLLSPLKGPHFLRQQPSTYLTKAPLPSNRVVIFALRAVQAHSESKRYSKGLATYMQISFGLGFIGITNDLVNLIRCLLVNATYGPEKYSESAAASSKGGLLSPPPEGTPDLPRMRFWARRFTDLLGLAFLAATVPGIIANSNYSKVFDDQKQADMTARNRFVHCFDSSRFVQPLMDDMQNNQFGHRISSCDTLYLRRSVGQIQTAACAQATRVRVEPSVYTSRECALLVYSP